MRHLMIVPASIVMGLVGCSSVQQKGTVTMAGRGAAELTDRGDPLMGTGVYAKKVPAEFAMGYAKGVSDQTKREYWAMQDAQQAPASSSGKTVYYNLTIPEHKDEDGVERAQRQVIVPIVE
jgi:hypothetical protein